MNKVNNVPSPYIIPGLLRGKLDESIIIKEDIPAGACL